MKASDVARQLAARILSQDHPGDARDPLDATSGAKITDQRVTTFRIRTNEGQVFQVEVVYLGRYDEIFVKAEEGNEG